MMWRHVNPKRQPIFNGLHGVRPKAQKILATAMQPQFAYDVTCSQARQDLGCFTKSA
jgi:hypothetical protein